MRALAAVLLAAALAGCSNGTPKAAPSSSVASASPTPSGLVATAGQYGRAIAKYVHGLRDSAGNIDACAGTTDSLCAMNAPIAAQSADLLLSVLAHCQQPGSDFYIGKPPPEIEGLVADTRGATEKVKQLGFAYRTGDPWAPLVTAADALMATLDRWAPYGV